MFVLFRVINGHCSGSLINKYPNYKSSNKEKKSQTAVCAYEYLFFTDKYKNE